MKTLPMVLLTAMISFAGAAGAAVVLPTGESVAAGSANVVRSGGAMTVTNSNGAIINWNSFSVGAGGTVQFVQSGAGSKVLNRVIGGDPSSIYGTIASNGQVFLVNPNGIMVGPGGSIQASAIFLSTANIADADFLAGNLQFQAPPAATPIVVSGTLTATNLIDIRASSFDGTGSTISAPTMNIDVGGGAITIGGGGVIGGGGIVGGGGGITIGGGGIVTGSGSFVGGSLSLGTGNITVQSETTRKLLQQTAGSISLGGTSALPASTPSTSPAATASLPARGAVTVTRANTGALVDGVVTVRLSLVDASPIALR